MPGRPAARGGPRGQPGRGRRGEQRDPALTAARRLVLWRHGQTAWNVEHRFQGQTDIHLDATGVGQADRAARRLATLGPAAIVSSDLSRAQQTAAALARHTGLTVTLDKDLRERFGGDWEGLADAEIRERYPAERATWNPPNGEPTRVVADRMAGAFTRIAASLADGELAVVVSHGAALRLGLERALGLPPEAGATLGSLVNCSWSVIELRRDRWRLLEYNVVAQDPDMFAPNATATTSLIPEPITGDDST